MDDLNASSFSFCRFWWPMFLMTSNCWMMLKSLSCSFTWSATIFRYSTITPSLPACIVHTSHGGVMDLVVIYANFSTHCQHVRTETGIRQSARTWSHPIVMLRVCCLIILFLAVGLGLLLPPICFNMWRVVCSEMLCSASLFLLRDVVCGLAPHLLGGINPAILLWSPSLWEYFCPHGGSYLDVFWLFAQSLVNISHCSESIPNQMSLSCLNQCVLTATTTVNLTDWMVWV